MPKNFGENPLLPAILQVLRNAEKRLAIHELLQAIKHQTSLPVLHENEQLALFRLNWLLMNGLYQLQQRFLASGLYLHISTLAIYLEPVSNDEAKRQALTNDKLRSYYLDWQQFSDTTVAEVKALLEGLCWPKPCEQMLTDARGLLGVDAKACSKTIQHAYRRKVQQCHPDKGGNQQQFIAVQQAYELLKKH